MKAVVLYRPESDHAREVEEYVTNMQRQRNMTIEQASLETREGAELAKLYGIVTYPALLITQDTGELLKYWEGMPFPLMNEVAGYFQ